MTSGLNLNSLRAQQARLAAKTGGRTSLLLSLGAGILLAIALGLLLKGTSNHFGYGCLALALLAAMVELWYRRSLSKLPPNIPARTLDDIIEPKLLARFKKGSELTPQSAWQAAVGTWQARFIVNHLLLPTDQLGRILSNVPADMAAVWDSARSLTGQESSELDGSILVSALIITSKPTLEAIARLNLKQEDIIETCTWFRRLDKALAEPRPHFGGIGRDWAAGYTPMLDRFGQNISAGVEAGHGHFHTLAHGDVLASVVHSLSQPRGSVAFVGPAGTGKTSMVYALAERLLAGHDQGLLYYQIISLNASLILSAAGNKLETIMLNLFAEAAHARNIIIFLDEAQLFFGKGAGAFDASQILLPMLENQAVKLIATFTPEDWQQLKANQSALTNYLSPIIIKEPDQATTLKILEDTALTMEVQNNILISYQAVQEAYRLSDQYMQDQAYPGKAINLLQQAIPYVAGKIMTAESVQSAVEKTRGVKVAKAEAAEADVLLHMEEKIHQRMINQARAVQVVAAALRRGRAGVGDPKRPIGSFLFLGPTGVGKTELARSLAAVYFGDEYQMLRLDMTEYQQPDDVERLLATGGPTDKSLILKIREQPFSVVLLDEVEKANQAVLNLLLQLLDEGQLTDTAGRPASFRNAIVIATSNAGSAEISQRVAHGDSLESFERPLIDELIAVGQFKAELINRFDEVVLFRPLNQSEIGQVARLMLAEVNNNLTKQNVAVQLTDAALGALVQAGYDPQFGARPMRRVIQESVENTVATRILGGQANPGTTITLDTADLNLSHKIT